MVAPDLPRLLRVGVAKLASCDGCQLTLLGLGPLLLELGQRFELVEFPEASSNRSAGPYDVLLVEGSVSDAAQAEHIRALRARTAVLATIGTCATFGGIQALRNWAMSDISGSVYSRPEEIDVLPTSTPIAEHVTVDVHLTGCPIDGGQLLELLTAVAVGRRPQLPDEAVCGTCKRLGRVCVVVARGEACLGPVTRTGCGAICPGMDRGCYGCFGPREQANVEGLAADMALRGDDTATIARRLAGFTAWAPEFRAAINARGGPPGFPVSAATLTSRSAAEEQGHGPRA